MNIAYVGNQNSTKDIINIFAHSLSISKFYLHCQRNYTRQDAFLC